MNRTSSFADAETSFLSELNQYAALPYVVTPSGLLVCLITSRGTGRWIVPKGWPKADLSPVTMAATEACEEAGLVGSTSMVPIGSYVYRKQLHRFATVNCRVTVFPMNVEIQKLKWREKGQRRIDWVSPKKAAKRVDEAELSKLILNLHDWLAENASNPHPVL
ncbi:MAG: NUDIX hydrolase [Hyphomicrobiaceae bacterium]|nr:NUDIX hydrolase [Hyphomicrobiaceae bacterium]